MKQVFRIVYYAGLLLALWGAVTALLTDMAVVWVGVLLTSFPPLLNVVWCFDNGDSPSRKARFPKLSLFVLTGLAWVLLPLDDRSAALWLALGCLGGFLLNSYWAVNQNSQEERLR